MAVLLEAAAEIFAAMVDPEPDRPRTGQRDFGPIHALRKRQSGTLLNGATSD